MTKKKKEVQGELIYGINPITELLKAKRRKLLRIYTTKPTPKAWSKIESLIPSHTPIQYIDKNALTKLAGTIDHQGMVAWVGSFGYRSKPFDPSRHQFLLMLDGVQDPRNLGAILRSAYCTGVDGVIISSRGGSPLNAAAIKASAGLAEHLEIMIAPSLVTVATQLQEAGYSIFVTSFEGKNATEISYKRPLCVVIGSEGEGIAPALMKLGTRITLPQRMPDISYNASVAAGILLFLVASKEGII